MSAPPIETRLSPGSLLSAVEQLGAAELDGFVSQVLALQARRRAPSLPAEEAELLLRINRGLPAELRARLEELGERREAEELTPAEQAELVALADRVEALEAERVESLTRLAALRGVLLSTLMEQLGIAPAHDD
jgi:hypothetical protein